MSYPTTDVGYPTTAAAPPTTAADYPQTTGYPSTTGSSVEYACLVPFDTSTVAASTGDGQPQPLCPSPQIAQSYFVQECAWAEVLGMAQYIPDQNECCYPMNMWPCDWSYSSAD